VLHWSYWPAKLLWLSRSQPDTFGRARRWVSFGEYLALRLFGQAEAEVDNIARAADAFRDATMRVLRIAFLSSASLEFFASVAVAVVAICVGLWGVALSVAFAAPVVYVVAAIVAIWPVTIALPYVGGRELRRLIAGSLVVSVASALLSLRPQPFPLDPVPGWLIAAAPAVVVPALSGLILLLLWQHSNRLNETLARLLAANDRTVDETLQAFMARRHDRCKFVLDASLQIGQWEVERAVDADFIGVQARVAEMTEAPFLDDL
jgi:ABC-type multidrug transport system fused ATPase/permease subunit